MDELRRGNGPLPPRSRAVGRAASRAALRRGGGNQKRFRFFNKKWFLLVFLTAILLVIGGCSAVVMSAKTYDLDDLKKMEYASAIQDAKGNEVVKLGAVNREPVKLSQIKSPELYKTFVKVEDERFYDHNGIDYKGFARAIVKNIIALGKAEGASTITMQVARNAILQDREKTYSRKLKEIGVALNLEKEYSKDEILETYLNYIYLGNDVAGIKMAAKIYFDKDITKEKLEPQEIALLAGLPKAPEGYNPFVNPDEALKRRNIVLDKMAQEDSAIEPLITKEEAEAAKKKPLGVKKEYLEKHLQKNNYTAYKEYVIREAEKRYGIDKDDLLNGGYKIKTGLNPKAQKAAEEALRDEKFYQGHENLDAGLTMIDPKTGRIAAIGGGRKYLPGYALRAVENHQPGSTIKPITVFAPAVDVAGMNEYSIVPDEEIQIGQWTPKNYDGEFHGKIEMKETVAKSLNASTVWILKEKVKLANAARYAENAGLELHDKDRGSYAALALGGLTEGVDTVEMAQAYTAFPNNGQVTQAHAISQIVDPDGKVLEPVDGAEIQKKRVYTPKAAWYTTRMLKNAVENGTGIYAQLADGRDLAGKTGTTQNSKEAWFVGYTPDYVTAVTVFNQNGNEVELTGGGYPAKIFKEVMEKTLAGTPPKSFQKPPGVPEPEPPFELKSVADLSGSYNDAAQAIELSWTDYDPTNRVKYRVERSEDQSNWKRIGATMEGSFTDNSIKVPKPKKNGEWEDFFGGGGAEPKRYYYRVIAVDTQAEDESLKEAEPSNVLEVVVQPTQQPPEEDEDERDQPGDQQGDDQGNQQGPGGFLDGGDQQTTGGNQQGPGGNQQGPGGRQQGGDQTTDGGQEDDGGIFGNY